MVDIRHYQKYSMPSKVGYEVKRQKKQSDLASQIVGQIRSPEFMKGQINLCLLVMVIILLAFSL